ncbi:bifunctional diguanylate cyclase/phosphodiesterase [Vibrio albus]|uniref:Bifunctional diguanylate cyclase/phosphodiesterase n=1 Tax=Vibrio albus TaxID=2200953 RepID=A0A2U3B957_9VIBR|nr:EAL domain-containing protein [Vibrio albus]PWI33339.1 bifunctional diguanylate cyclase/phosphodiesterase [Vibrio albus]
MTNQGLNLIPILLTFVGLLMLMYSLRPTAAICKKSQQKGWCLLYYLILFFVLGYLISLIRFVSAPVFTVEYLVHSLILVSGGLFVLMVTQLSHRSILQVEESTSREEYNALHDSLTSLGNRHYLHRAATSLIRERTSFTLLVIDLNNFRQINNAIGHYLGDELIRALSIKLRQHLPEQCSIYRMSGDEFTLLWEKTTDIELELLANQIHELLSSPLDIHGYSLHISASIGVSCYPRHSGNIEKLLQQAELAMYACKRRGSEYLVFSEELNQGAKEKLAIAARLKEALKSKEFQLYYQPVIESADSSVHGAEILIRWPQEDGSFIPPNLFIPIAEQSSMINEITCWVIQQCLLELPALKKAGFKGNLHINLSAKDMHNPSLVTQLKGAVSKGEIQPQQLIFEITESTMMTDINQARKMMTLLARTGFSFSIDDFGTGFSSLSLLKVLPLSQIKIDQSFVTDMEASSSNTSIVNSVIYLAKSLEYSVVAEGIEDRQTADRLCSMGCHYLQGYYFSKPLPLDSFTQYLQNQKTLVH